MTERLPTFRLSQYRTLIFDCDGVILDSNAIKTEAFYQAALPYGEQAARTLQRYHVRNGGISRYHKIDWFLTEVIGQNEPNIHDRDCLLNAYAQNVWERMLACDVDEEIFKLREHVPDAQWMVASGSDENELREILQIRQLDHLFDAGIYGSPRTKEEIFEEVERELNVFRPAIFLGDSHYDAYVAKLAGIEFLFVSHWSEVATPESVPCVHNISSCLQCI